MTPQSNTPDYRCQHPRLTWDILFGKGFCLDCNAKVRAWHGEWSECVVSERGTPTDRDSYDRLLSFVRQVARGNSYADRDTATTILREIGEET